MRAAVLLLLFLASLPGLAGERVLPEVVFEAPPALAGTLRDLKAVPDSRIMGVVDQAGLTAAGPPVRVILAEETASVAQFTPSWVNGFANPRASTIVLFPGRSPAYPDNSIEDVFVHEMAHIILFRASNGYPVPRWFNEGFAMHAGRDAGLRDRFFLLADALFEGPVSLDVVDRMFEGQRSEVRKAYVLAGALYRDLAARHGSGVTARILRETGKGTPFEEAFRRATGLPLVFFVFDFWEEFKTVDFWLPVIANNTLWWLVIVLLASIAVKRRRRISRLERERWELEEKLAAEKEAESARPQPGAMIEPGAAEDDVSNWPVN